MRHPTPDEVRATRDRLQCGLLEARELLIRQYRNEFIDDIKSKIQNSDQRDTEVGRILLDIVEILRG